MQPFRELLSWGSPAHPSRGDRAGRWCALLVAAALVPLLPLLLGLAVPIPHDIFISDLLHSQLPYKAFLGESLRNGQFPLWMPDIFSGVPFLAQVEAGALHPPHLVLFGLLEPWTALGWALAFDLALGSIGTFLLVRRLGGGAPGAALGGIAWAWSGFNVTHVRHLNMHAGAALLPWMLLSLERLLATGGRRGGVPLALFLALQVAAGHPQITYISLLLLLARTGVHLLSRRRGLFSQDPRSAIKVALLAVAALLLGGGLLAAQLVPTALFTRDSLGQVAPTWEYASAFPFPPKDLLAFIWPPLVGSMEGYDYRGANTLPWGNYGYFGLFPLLLAVVTLVARRDGATRFWGAAALISLLLVLGPATPLYRLAWEWLPGMSMFRLPTRFLMVVGLAGAVLAGLGLGRLLALPVFHGRARLAVVVSLAVFLGTTADLAHHGRTRLPMDEAAHWRDAPALGEAAGSVSGRVLSLHEFATWELAFHRARGFNEGAAPYRALWAMPMGSSGVLQGLWSPSGYARMVHWRCAAFWQPYNRDILPADHRPEEPVPASPQVTPALASLLDRGSVELLLSTFPLEGDGLSLVARGPALIYRRGSALPRAYQVSAWRSVASIGEAARWMLEEGAHQPGVPAIEGAPSPLTEELELVPAEVVDLGPQRVEVHVPPSAPQGWLVLGDTWDPGWRATVDGEELEIHVANGYQRAVMAPPGAVVEFRYRPPGLLLGLALSGVSLAGLLVWAIIARRRRGPRAPTMASP